MKVTIGLQLSPQHGDFDDMRKAWMEAEALGVDCLYSADHFNAMILDEAQALRTATDGEYGKILRGKNYEGGRNASVGALMSTSSSGTVFKSTARASDGDPLFHTPGPQAVDILNCSSTLETTGDI